MCGKMCNKASESGHEFEKCGTEQTKQKEAIETSKTIIKIPHRQKGLISSKKDPQSIHAQFEAKDKNKEHKQQQSNF